MYEMNYGIAMTQWKSLLKDNPIDWLLEDTNPSVRYYALRNILEKSTDVPEIVAAKNAIMKSHVITTILDKQHPDGYWGVPEDFYIRSKYKGTVWSFIILAALGADKNDIRIQNTCEFILKNSQDPSSGGFSYQSSSKGGGAPGKVLPCLTGNMVWCLIRFGYLDDPRVQKGIEWITKYQRFDDGEQNLPKDWPYKVHKACFGKHSCHMGVVKALKALAEIPENKRKPNVKNTINQAVEYLLIHHIYKRSHDLNHVAKAEWLQFGFPLMWKTDALEMLLVLTQLRVKDKRMQDAVDLVISKQNDEGRWMLEKTFNGRMQVSIERKGKPSKWITLHALRMLKRYYD